MGFGSAAPGIAGQVLSSNGPAADPSFQALPPLWQIPNHSVPVGRGAGVTNFGSAIGTIGQVFVSNGPAADPSFQSLSNFTADAPPNPGTAGFTPAPPSGATARGQLLTPNGWGDRKPLSRFVVPSDFVNKVYTFQNRSDVAPLTQNGSGLGSVTMTRTPSDVWRSVVRQNALSDTYGYVDPINGNDANGPACLQATPCKTLAYAMNTATALNIVGVSTGPFDAFSWTGGQFFKRLTFTGPAVIRTTGAAFPAMTAQTFTVTGTPSVYVTTLSGLTSLAAVQRFIFLDTFEPGTGNNVRVPMYASLAALNAASSGSPSTVNGWFFDPATKNLYVAFSNFNVNTFKSKFAALYLDTNGDSAVSIVGGVTLFIDSPYSVLLEGSSIEAVNSGASVPSVIVEGRGLFKIFAAAGNCVHTAGGFHYFSGMDNEACQFDGFNHDPSLSTNAESLVIIHNSKTEYAGDTATFGTSVTPNRNGWSCHGGANCVVAGSSFGFSFGPNAADVATAGVTSLSWVVGVETTKTLSGDAGFGFFGNAGDPTAIRKVWIDSSSTLDEAVSLSGSEIGVTIKYLSGAYNVPPVVTGGATLTPYIRSVP